MEMRIESPTRLYLPSDSTDVQRFLTFRDRSVDYQIGKMKRNFRWKGNDPEGFEEKMEALKSQAQKSLLFHDQDGRPYTYSGLWKELHQRFHWSLTGLEANVKTQAMPWHIKPEHEMHYYQSDSVEELIKARHAAIELPTGSGKSLILINLAKRLPARSLIVTPFTAITDSLYDQFVSAFGSKYVGKYGSGSKKLGRLFTVATSDSIANIEEGSEAWDWFSGCEVLMWDESHTTPADTFERAAMGVCANAQYRFFVSATQIRNDGSEMVLQGLTGPVVYRKSFMELVNEGYLAKQAFNIIEVPANGFVNRLDPKMETRAQLYNNPYVNTIAASIANNAVLEQKRPTLIIIEEFKQFINLRNHLNVPFEFVHGGVDKESKKYVPEEFWKVDKQKTLENFNSGRTKLVVGTSAIATGVDWKPTGCNIYLQGGTSEIKVKQAVGRGTRIFPGKQDCINFDFRVMGSKTMERHSGIREGFYNSMGEVRVHRGQR